MRSLVHETNGSSGNRSSPTAATSDFTNPNSEISITAIYYVIDSDHLICGLDNGSLALYSTKDGLNKKDICQHLARKWLSAITWNSEGRILASLAGKFNIMLDKISADWTREEHAFHFDAKQPVRHFALTSYPLTQQVMIANSHRVEIWSHNESGTFRFSRTAVKDIQSEGIWTIVSRSIRDSLLLIEPFMVRTSSLTNLNQISVHGLALKSHLVCSIDSPAGQLSVVELLRVSTAAWPGQRFVMSLGSPDSAQVHAIPSTAGGYELYLFESPLIDADGQDSALAPGPSPCHIIPISPYIEHIIGLLPDGNSYSS